MMNTSQLWSPDEDGPVTADKAPWDGVQIFLLGTTGSGKSTFLECLCAEQNLSIAKDTLDSVTHEVTGYFLNNVWWQKAQPYPIVIVDTPGFGDNRMSEARAVAKLRKWIKKNPTRHHYHVLYFERITDTRMSGSKKTALEIFQDIVGAHAAKSVVFVTTMWDQIYNAEQEDRAFLRFDQLRSQHLATFRKNFLNDGARILDFDGDQKSANQILAFTMETTQHQPIALQVQNLETGKWGVRIKHFAQWKDDFGDHVGQPLGQPNLPPTRPYTILVHAKLMERIEQLKERIRILDLDLRQDDARNDTELTKELEEMRRDVVIQLSALERI
ncbi:hypothetical protein CVT24_010129 [Panaeolus cyanescens]|uniref:G domain-containing protein n=1 Tax=Panaeolus cyanescens TaxID=181874 RepID=A0A409W9L8_9AGAR|nr:hypothetical protein CVT24_010129 [Panaeolus cyanescens]